MEDTILYLPHPTGLSLSPRKRSRCTPDLPEVRKCNKLDKLEKKSISDVKWENAIVGDIEFEERDRGGSKKLKVVGGPKSPKDQQTFNVKDRNRNVDNRETGEYLDLEIEKLHQSSFASNCVEATDSFLDSDNQVVMDIVLVDVQLTVLGSPGARNAPFVSLRSEAYGVAVSGYQLAVGEIRDTSEAVLLSDESGDRWSRFDQLVWRTSKRTPVCYVSSSLPTSISKNVQAGPVREKSLLKKGKSPMKLQKKTKKQFDGKTAPKKACVPVELIFSKILAAVN